METYEDCPNCGHTPAYGGTFMVYECDKCHTLYCDECGGDACPECKAKERQEAGECHRRG